MTGPVGAVAPAGPVTYHGERVASQGVNMANDSKPETADTVRALVALRGLGRTFSLYPDIVTAAFDRGSRPIGSFPVTFTATTDPANRFAADPEAGE
jgi:hypothetical protein